MQSRCGRGVAARLLRPGARLASRAPSPSTAAVANWRGLGLVPIAGWSLGRVGPGRGLLGGGRRGWCEEWARRG
jgi:hypothetical protein